jgi:multicomponent Na+:H+ antiporter subunit C
MSHLPYLLAGWILLVGIYGMVSSRNLVHAVVCLSVAQSATYVLLLSIGYRKKATAPVFSDIKPTRNVVDAVVQAMTLTDIVVGATATALLLALTVQVAKRRGTVDPDELGSLES